MISQKRNWQKVLVIILALGFLYITNLFVSRKSPKEKVAELISHHQGVILFIKSNTEKDRDFSFALKNIKPKLSGKADIVIAEPNTDILKEDERDLLPILIVLDSHGNELHRFTGSLDISILQELVHQLATHHH